MDIKQVEKLLADHSFKFAKSMPTSPHWYTLRKDWDDETFVEVVKFIREHGTPEKFYKATYIYLHLNGFKYWTMGAPLDITILINKAAI